MSETNVVEEHPIELEPSVDGVTLGYEFEEGGCSIIVTRDGGIIFSDEQNRAEYVSLTDSNTFWQIFRFLKKLAETQRLKPVEGWVKPKPSDKFHYFVNGDSLCGHHILPNWRESEYEPSVGPEGVCALCSKLYLEKECGGLIYEPESLNDVERKTTITLHRVDGEGDDAELHPYVTTITPSMKKEMLEAVEEAREAGVREPVLLLPAIPSDDELDWTSLRFPFLFYGYKAYFVPGILEIRVCDGAPHIPHKSKEEEEREMV